jgi:S-DNA-T family DNA segregation ATPase FtsK/SpoIIIE
MDVYKGKLSFVLGRDVTGEIVVGDLAKMPHLLVAGATGSGKSVMINALIASLLYRNSPSELKLILVDPKRVELTPYNGIPHLLAPVIVEPDRTVSALKWAVAEMERRYRLFAETNNKNIADYTVSHRAETGKKG